ncbi:T9SS type A sorting domain-containing protein [candidate division KSB1 bacterium]|nr:T9SS type A sorting domain-containing protein [candidate division KSB1 bacterium]
MFFQSQQSLQRNRCISFILLLLFLVFNQVKPAWFEQNETPSLQPTGRIFWGQYNVMCSSEDYVFVGAGGSVLVCRVLAENYFPVIHYINTPTLVKSLYVRDNTLFVLDQYCGLFVYDISSIYHPCLLSTLEMSKESMSFVAGNNNLFIRHRTEGISKIDISHINEPVVTMSDTLNSYDLYLHGDHLYSHYIGQEESVFRILKCETLEQVGQLNYTNWATLWEYVNLLFFKNTAYFVENHGGVLSKKSSPSSSWGEIRTWDIKDPTHPEYLKTYDLALPISAAINDGDTLYVAYENKIGIFDLSNPEQMEFVAEQYQVLNNKNAGQLLIKQPFLFAGFTGAGVQVARIKNNFKLVSGYYLDTKADYGSLCTIDSILISGHESSDGLVVTNIADLHKFKIKQKYSFKTVYIRDMVLRENFIYAATGKGMSVFSVDHNGNIDSLATIDIGKTCTSLALNDSLAVFGGSYSNVHLADISDPVMPRNITEINMPNGMAVDEILLRNHLLIVGGDYNGPLIFDITTPELPVLVNHQHSYRNAVNCSGDGRYLFVAENNELIVYDLSNPENPAAVKSVTIPEDVRRMYIKDNYLVAVFFDQYKYESDIYFFDISNLPDLRLLKTAFIPASINYVYMNDHNIFISNNKNGIYVYNIKDLLTSVSFNKYNPKKAQSHVLYQNYPNPFKAGTTIHFELDNPGNAAVKIFDLHGRLVRTFEKNILSAGRFSVMWNGCNNSERQVASGLYFYTLYVNENPIVTRNMVLIK